MSRGINRSYCFEPGDLVSLEGEFFEVTGNFLQPVDVINYVNLQCISHRQSTEIVSYTVPQSLLRGAINSGSGRLWKDALKERDYGN